MLHRVLASSRYLILIVIIATLVASLALLVYQAIVVFTVLVEVIQQGSGLPTSTKRLAVGVIEMMDVFLIAIVAEIMSLGLYTLFIDDTFPLPRWLKMDSLDDLKNHLVSVVIVVLAVLFLREAVERSADLDLLRLGAALSLIIASLTFFLTMKIGRNAAIPPKSGP